MPNSIDSLRSAVALGALWSLLTLGGQAGTTRASADEPRRPNVVLIMSDDQGYGDLGVHGNRMIRTPRLDALARESLRLTNFHVDPTCSETRAALLTGRYSCRVGVWHTIQGRSLLDERVPTLADRFVAAGYRTGIFGKWHLGDQYPLRAQDRGFERTLTIGGGGIGQTPDAWGNDYRDPTLSSDGHLEKFSGYCTDLFFDHAIEFIVGTRDRPFFCYVPTNVPHSPYRIDDAARDAVRARGVPDPMAAFYAMIENLDANVGRLLDTLDRLGIADDTIVIFMTDNGTAAGVMPSRDDDAAAWTGFDAGMRGQKGSPYEGGHRVPCFIRWPAGGFEPGSIDRLTAHLDLAPTLAEWCSLPIDLAGFDADPATRAYPSDPTRFDGRSLVPLVRGEAWPERTLVVHSQRRPIPEPRHQTAVMTDRWRLVRGKELYDLTVDPGQTRDVASEHPDVVAQLDEFYERWWQRVSVDFDRPVRVRIGAAAQPVVTLTAHDWHAPQEEIPWDQSHVRRDLPGIGTWKLQAVAAGEYRVELRMRPPGVDYRFEAGTAVLWIDDRDIEVDVVAGSDVVTFETRIAEGPFSLSSMVREAGKPDRGAYFVTLERL